MELRNRYMAAESRYDENNIMYRRCGRSGVLLPKVSLGFWHNFGANDPFERSRAITHYASTTASPTSTLPTITARPMAVPRKPWDDS